MLLSNVQTVKPQTIIANKTKDLHSKAQILQQYLAILTNALVGFFFRFLLNGFNIFICFLFFPNLDSKY